MLKTYLIMSCNRSGRGFSRWFRLFYELKNDVAKTIVANNRQAGQMWRIMEINCLIMADCRNQCKPFCLLKASLLMPIDTITFYF